MSSSSFPFKLGVVDSLIEHDAVDSLIEYDAVDLLIEDDAVDSLMEQAIKRLIIVVFVPDLLTFCFAHNSRSLSALSRSKLDLVLSSLGGIALSVPIVTHF